MKNPTRLRKGFTLVEFMIVMGIFAMMSAIVMASLLRPQNKANLDTSVLILVSDLRSQQLKAMAGDNNGKSVTEPLGIYFQANSYTLFQGATYSAADALNFVVQTDTPITISNTLTGSQVIFDRLSGEVSAITGSNNQVTMTNVNSGEQKTITINRYGIVLGN